MTNEIICGNKKVENVQGLVVHWHGKNSRITLEDNTMFVNCFINVGEDNEIFIGKTTSPIMNLSIPSPMSRGSKLIIGKDFSCAGAQINLQGESNLKLIIGNDVMFSYDIYIWGSDGHTIYDINSTKIVNSPSKGIYIGNHCWIGHAVHILKNTSISDNTVVATRSVVNKRFVEKNCVIGGVPAKILKKGVCWDRENTENFMKRISEIKSRDCGGQKNLEHKIKLPKFLGRIVCCFILKKKNRKRFRKNHIR